MNSFKNPLLWATLLFLAAAIYVSRGGLSGPANDPGFITAEELGKLSIGLKVAHEPEVALATEIGRSASPAKYRWWYKTTVSAIGGEVTIVEFGALAWHDGRWVTGGSITERPYTAKEFADWYSCPNAVIKPGETYSDPTNWSSSSELLAEKSRWYYIGVDGSGRRVKGEAIVEQRAEIDPKRPKDPE